MYKDFFDRMEKQNETAVSACQSAIETEKHIADVKEATMQEQINLLKQQVEEYKAQYELLKKKRGIGCTLKKIFTLGISRC